LTKFDYFSIAPRRQFKFNALGDHPRENGRVGNNRRWQERAEWNAHELQSNPGEIGSSLSGLKIATFLGFVEPSHN
jgi:hypothetical protein